MPRNRGQRRLDARRDRALGRGERPTQLATTDPAARASGRRADPPAGRAEPPRGYISAPGSGASWAPLDPLTPPKPSKQSPAYAQKGDTRTFGVSGTPITSGFLLDLGEYNPSLYGRIAVQTYEKMRRGDAQVKAILQACKLPVLSAKWMIAPSIDKSEPGHARAKETAEYVEDNLFGGLEYQSSSGGWISQSWSSVIANALLMLDFGCAVHEDNWRVDGGDIRLRNLPSRLPLTFYRWHTDPDGETLIAIEQYGYRGNDFKNVTLPAEQIARFTYQQEGANFWGIALLRAMYPAWYYKDRLQRIDAIAAERNGVGVPVFRLSPGFSPQDRDAAYNFVTQLGAHEAMGIVEPPSQGEPNSGFRIEVPKSQQRDIMKSISYYNLEMTRASLAMFMTSGVTPYGNRATTKEHTDFFMLSEQSIADDIAEIITNSTIRRLVEYQFGLGAPVPDLIAANVQARQLEDMVDGLTHMAMAGLVVSEKNLRAYIREELAIPEESAEDIVTIRGQTVERGVVEPGQEVGQHPETLPQPAAGKGKGAAAGSQNGDFSYAALADDPRVHQLSQSSEFLLQQPVMFHGSRPRSPWALRLRACGPVRASGRFRVLSVSADRTIDIEEVTVNEVR